MRTLSKNQLLGFAITSGIVFVVFLFANVGCLMWMGLIGTLVFGIWWFNRYQRDQEIIKQASAARHTDLYPAISSTPKLPPQVTPGSSYVGPIDLFENQ